MDLRQIGWDGMVWTGSNWFRIGTSGGMAVVNTVMNIQVP
jgi:hypothetical protein